MPARTICIASAKGGSGKTGLTATFGAFLSELGQKVLLVDGDFATCGLTLLYLKEVGARANVVHSMSRSPVGLCEAIAEPLACDEVELREGLSLIPASYRLPAVGVPSREITRQRLSSLLHDLRHRFDFILIDAQTGAAEMAQIAMSRKVADEVVVVSETDRISAAAVERLRAQLREDLTSDRASILLNKVPPSELANSPADFLENAKHLGPIPWETEVARTHARRGLALDTEAGNDYALSILRTLKGLCGESIQRQFETWVQSYTAVVRQPLEEQHVDAEKEMALLLSYKSRMKRRAQASRWVGLLIAMTGIIASAWVYYNAEQTGLSVEEFAPFLAGTSVVALYGFLRLFGREGAKAQLDSARVDRRLGLLTERLKRLELLSTLDPPASRQRHDARADGAFAPFGKHPEAAH
jgi:MinD-like ATPase involved in chromosome partitioning or flagellar assembly